MARITDEVEVLLFGFCLLDSQTFAVLPDVALFACHTMGAVIDLAVDTTDTVKYPVVLFFLELLQSLLVLLDLGVKPALRETASSCEILGSFRELGEFPFVLYAASLALFEAVLSRH
jgi:hypothetical protein